MFIRRTQNRSRISGEPHVTYRLVQSERVGQAVKQSTVLNLGSHFDLPPAHWPALTRRIRRLSGPSPTASWLQRCGAGNGGGGCGLICACLRLTPRP